MKFLAITIVLNIVSNVASCGRRSNFCCEANSTDYCCCEAVRQFLILNCEKSQQRYRRYTFIKCGDHHEAEQMKKSKFNCHGCVNGFKC